MPAVCAPVFAHAHATNVHEYNHVRHLLEGSVCFTTVACRGDAYQRVAFIGGRHFGVNTVHVHDWTSWGTQEIVRCWQPGVCGIASSYYLKVR